MPLTTGDRIADLAIRGHRVRVAAAGGPPAPGKPGHSKYVCSCGAETLRPWAQKSSWPEFVRGHHTAVLEAATGG